MTSPVTVTCCGASAGLSGRAGCSYSIRPGQSHYHRPARSRFGNNRPVVLPNHRVIGQTDNISRCSRSRVDAGMTHPSLWLTSFLGVLPSGTCIWGVVCPRLSIFHCHVRRRHISGGGLHAHTCDGFFLEGIVLWPPCAQPLRSRQLFLVVDGYLSPRFRTRWKFRTCWKSRPRRSTGWSAPRPGANG